jgi:hypothetical protein
VKYDTIDYIHWGWIPILELETTLERSVATRGVLMLGVACLV